MQNYNTHKFLEQNEFAYRLTYSLYFTFFYAIFWNLNKVTHSNQ